jgi:UPF0042 nucleotide-binding protein
VALRAVEDSGFVCVDNLPPQLMDQFVRVAARRDGHPDVAIGIDIREKQFIPEFQSVLRHLRKKYGIIVIYLEADRHALIRRYKETRRPHPIGGCALDECIDIEAGMLAPFREQADRIIDTTSMTPHQLRSLVMSLLGIKTAFQVVLMSFGYKYGIPQGADLLFDARFLPNPFFVPELKELTGLDEPVKKFVMTTKDASEFVRRLEGFLSFLMPKFKAEGKSSVTVGIGCTGGRHRSPVIAELVARKLRTMGLDVSVVHRDI